MKCILLLSGGLDSAVLLYRLRDSGHTVNCLTVDYGQRHRREIDSARALCLRAGVEHRVVDLSAVTPLLGDSALTSDTPVPLKPYDLASLSVTVVPNRNMILLSLATAWAVSLRYDAVAYAAHGGDHAIYPDCRPEFADAMDRAIQRCDTHPVRLLRPAIGETKADLVAAGEALGVPFELTWSCYQGGAMHCGRCATCIERRDAFTQANVPDPTGYSH